MNKKNPKNTTKKNNKKHMHTKNKLSSAAIVIGALIFTTLLANSAEDKLRIFFLFLPRNKI